MVYGLIVMVYGFIVIHKIKTNSLSKNPKFRKPAKHKFETIKPTFESKKKKRKLQSANKFSATAFPNYFLKVSIYWRKMR